MTKSHAPVAAPVVTPVRSGLIQRCSCGARSGPSGECAECKRKRRGLHRKAAAPRVPEQVPEVVNEIRRQPGRPLDAHTRVFMEARLGHDFSKVRIHTDAHAAQSASAVDARAYAVGNHVVFAEGHYDPGTREGRRLLAHELVHVMQQADSEASSVLEVADPRGRHEQEADRLADRALGQTSGVPAEVTTAPPQVARFGGKCMSQKVGYWGAAAAVLASCGAAVLTSETGVGLVVLGAACVASIIAYIAAIVALKECMETDPEADRREIERLRREQENMERRLRQVEELIGSDE